MKRHFKNIRLSSETFLMIIGGIVMLITILAWIRHDCFKYPVSVTAQCVVDRLLEGEMSARAERILMRERFSISHQVSTPPAKYPLEVSIVGKDGLENYLIDSIMDSKNIAMSAEMRMAQSISLMERPFQVDSFRKACEDSLAANLVYVDLGFKLYNKEKTVATSGNTSHISTFHTYVIGYGCEYRLEAFVQVPFFYDATVIVMTIVLVLVYLGIICCAYHLYKERKKVIPLVVEIKKKSYLLNGYWLYESEERCIYSLSSRTASYPKGEKNLFVTLPNREAQILDKLLQAPNYAIDENELYDKVWGLSSSMTKDNNLRSQISRLKSKLKGIGLTIIHDRKQYILQILSLKDDKNTGQSSPKAGSKKTDSGLSEHSEGNKRASGDYLKTIDNHLDSNGGG